MPTRRRLLIWLGVVALIAGAIVTLRITDDPHSSDTESDDKPRPVQISRFAADNVVLPAPSRKPAPPARIAATPEAGGLVVSWGNALPGGRAPSAATGYEVRWRPADDKNSGFDADWGTRLVSTPDIRLAPLTDGRRYRIEIRTVDAFGQRSAPAAVNGTPGRPDTSWTAALSGLRDDFADPRKWPTRWHLSGYRGCINVVSEKDNGLPVELGCGADVAVLRPRTPMTLHAGQPGTDSELGRVAVRTDAAAVGGELTVTLAPGPVDRVGEDTVRANRLPPTDPTLPGGTVRVGIDDEGVRVSAAPDVPKIAPPQVTLVPPPLRGPGVSHLFEVVLKSSGLYVYQDRQLVGTAGVAPAYTSASVLLGFRGPERRRSRVHVTGAGFSGAATTPPATVEVPINAGTQRVLNLTETAPQVGITRTPLDHAASARLVATIMLADGVDPRGVIAQFGEVRVPATPVVANPSTANGAAVTVAATVPAALLTAGGAPSITPFVLRATGANQQVRLVETYLDITPGPGWRPPKNNPITPMRHAQEDMLPSIDAVLSNAAGDPLTASVLPRQGQVILTVTMDASGAQWETGSIRGVQGFQVWLDGDLLAGVPTRADGPGLGGTHSLAITTSGMTVGAHLLEVREYAMSGTDRPLSAVLNFTVR